MAALPTRYSRWVYWAQNLVLGRGAGVQVLPPNFLIDVATDLPSNFMTFRKSISLHNDYICLSSREVKSHVCSFFCQQGTIMWYTLTVLLRGCLGFAFSGVLFLLLQSALLFYTFATYSHELSCTKRTLSSTLSTCLLGINFYILKENSCKLFGTFEKESIFCEVPWTQQSLYSPIEVEFSNYQLCGVRGGRGRDEPAK